MKLLSIVIVVSLSLCVAAYNKEISCLLPNLTSSTYDIWGFPVDTFKSGDEPALNAQDELDLIYSLLTYAIVYKTWQSDVGSSYTYKGFNFGALLISEHNEIAHWGRNMVFSEKDGTQHGEVRAIQQYLKKSKASSLQGFTIHVGGDSCPMCSGMISQQKIRRAVLGLTNPLFGKNFDRMNQDSRQCGVGDIKGLGPVPRKVTPSMSPSATRKKLDIEFRQLVVESCESSNIESCKKFPSQTDFLKSSVAFDLFENAFKDFLKYELVYPNEKAPQSRRSNKELYETAKNFFHNNVNL